jgi:MSHA pilin protein MshD
VTLVEMVIAIVIISIAAVALLQGLGFQTVRNVDPMIQSQAQALAKQYLEEAMSRSFFDPATDPRVFPSVNQATAVSSASDTTSSTADATNRIAFNNVFEFNSYDQPVQEPDGTPITELSGFQIEIEVDNSAGLTLGTFSNPAATCPPMVMQITVTVTDPRGQSTVLTGYRTSYFDAATRYGC